MASTSDERVEVARRLREAAEVEPPNVRRFIDLAPIIGADAAIAACGLDGAMDAARALADLIDPNVVHCRDCKWGKAVREIGCVRFDDRLNSAGNTDPMGYCAWAEEEASDGGE